MKTQLVRIGNSRGIRIPKPLIEQCGLDDAVDLRVEQDRLVIARARAPREGWRDTFAKVGPAARDSLLLDSVPANEFDAKEWTW